MTSTKLPRSTPLSLHQVALVAALIAAAAGAAAAEAGTTTERELKAHRHFTRALEFADQRAYPEALVELERARSAASHYALLYNIGQIYVALGQPKQALDAFSEYLAQGGDSIEPARREEVRAAVELARARLGRLELHVQPQGSVLHIDGERIGPTPTTPIELGPGVHQVTVLKPGYEPAQQRIALRGGERLALSLTLTPEPGPPEQGQVAVSCGISDVYTSMDGGPAAFLRPGVPIQLPVGWHRLDFRRDGYAPQSRWIQVRTGSVQRVPCSVVPLRRIPDAMSGELVVEPSQPDARIEIDGQVMRTARWPVGRHRVTVTRFGYEPWTGVVTLRAGTRTTVSAQLEATPALRREQWAIARSRRAWAFGLGAGALGLGGAAVALAVLAHQKSDAYLAEQRKLDQLLFAGRGTEALISRQAANDQRLDDAHVLELAAVGLGVGAVASAAATVAFYLLADREFTQSEPSRGGVSLRPGGWALAW